MNAQEILTSAGKAGNWGGQQSVEAVRSYMQLNQGPFLVWAGTKDAITYLEGKDIVEEVCRFVDETDRLDDFERAMDEEARIPYCGSSDHF